MAARVLNLQRTVGNQAALQLLGSRSVVPARKAVVQREGEDEAAPPDQGANSATAPGLQAALQQLIGKVQGLHDRVADSQEAAEYLPRVAGTLAQMRAAAMSNDEELQTAVVSAFTTERLSSAASQLELASEVPFGADEGESGDPLAEVVQTLAVQRWAPDRSGPAVQRDVGAAMMAAGTFLLATDAEAAPVEAAAGPPGWAVAGTVAIVAVGLIGIGYLMASAQPETLSKDEEEAITNKEAGRPYDKDAFTRGRRKQVKNEKYEGERNKNKQRGGG